MSDFNVRSLTCCAVFEISDLASCKTSLEALQKFWTYVTQFAAWNDDGTKPLPEGSYQKPFVLFTANTKPLVNYQGNYPGAKDNTKYGDNLRDFIQANNLGSVMESPEGVNWTRNTMKVYLWMPKYAPLQAMMKEFDKARYKAYQESRSAVRDLDELRLAGSRTSVSTVSTRITGNNSL